MRNIYKILISFIFFSLYPLHSVCMESPKAEPSLIQGPSPEAIIHPGNDSYPLLEQLATVQWKTLIKKIAASGSLSDVDGTDLFTSCYNTIYALAIVFIGENSAKDLFERISIINRIFLRLEIEDNVIEEYSIELFNGYVFCRIQEIGYNEFYKMSPEDQAENIRDFLRIQRKDFTCYIKKNIREIFDSNDSTATVKNNIDNYFTDIDYNFNEVTIKKLRETITKNNAIIGSNRSFIYFIFITNPEGFEHVFALEQFYEGQEKFRRYQSWIGRATFADDLLRNHEAWGTAKLNLFLNELEYAYSPEDHYIDVNLMACFGYDRASDLLVSYKDQRFQGLCLFFLAFPFAPQDCAKNVEGFLASSK